MGVARLVLWAIAAALSSAAVPVCAQSQYPVRSIRLIVPFAPGGATDILARMVSQKLNEAWGQQVIVDNRAGGNTVIGTDVAAKAAPDGYTLVMVSTSTTTTPSLMRKLPYDPLRDLAPVIMLVSTPNVLATHPSVPARSVGELIAIARARPGQVAYGSGGSGASTHLGGEILRLMGGVDMVHVPYKGTGPATIALLSGEVSWMFGAILPTLPFIKAGRLRAIAVSSVKRAAVLPEVPPVADTLPGFETSPWTGISAPAATPREVVVRLNQEIARAFTAADTRERLAREGNDVVANSPEEFDAFFRGEVRKWAKVIKDAGIRLE